MARDQLADLAMSVAAAQERSLTRAAVWRGGRQSSLNHALRRLEARAGLRLLTRTTRSVAPTDAGKRLLRTLRPAFAERGAGIASLSALRGKPAGSIRITTAEHAAETILMRALEQLLPRYPDSKVEITVDYGLMDLVAERFDAGVRLGEQVAKGMVAHRPGPAHGGDGGAVVLRRSPTAARPAGPLPPPVHQSAAAGVRWPVGVGVLKRRARGQGARRRTARLQRSAAGRASRERWPDGNGLVVLAAPGAGPAARDAAAQIPTYHAQPFCSEPILPRSSNSSLTTMRSRNLTLL